MTGLRLNFASITGASDANFQQKKLWCKVFVNLFILILTILTIFKRVYILCIDDTNITKKIL